MTKQRVAILTDFPRGWHESRLRRALRRRGAEAVLLSLQGCRMNLQRPHGLELPGFEKLPDAVFVRFIPAGSFEQVTFRLDILHALRELGVPVYNDARVIERTVDKAMTSFLLARAGVPTPPTWVCQSLEQAQSVLRRETAAGRKLVLKPLFGSRGQGLQRLDNSGALPAPDDYQGVYYLQAFVPPGGRDWRVMVIGGRAVTAMERRAASWITNRARGGQCHPALLAAPLAELAERATRTVDAGSAGVDIISDQDGAYQVLEINGLPAWKGLQSVCAFEIAELLVDDLLRRIPERRMEAAS
jgi:RimK family alpha-L-glutamate ligase